MGVSEGKSGQLLHRRGGVQESPGAGNQGQRQSQPVSWRVLVSLALERGPAAGVCAPGGVSVGVLGGEGEEAKPLCKGCAVQAAEQTASHTHTHTQRHTDASHVNHPTSESAPRIPVGE